MAAETVLDQMEWLVKEYGVREFMIVDDIFNFDLERAKTICRGIVERGLKVHLQFPNGVRGDRFDEELIALMKAAGTHYMAIAIETVSEKFQKLVRKNLKIDRARQSLEWARKHRIEVSGFFMIGFPGETLRGGPDNFWTSRSNRPSTRSAVDRDAVQRNQAPYRHDHRRLAR